MSIDNVTPNEWDAYRAGYVKSIFNKVEDDTPSEDKVNKPSHYNQGGIECIDYIAQQLGDGLVSYCQGNVIKYLHRWRYKNGLEDLKKAQWYLNKMIEAVQND